MNIVGLLLFCLNGTIWKNMDLCVAFATYFYLFCVPCLSSVQARSQQDQTQDSWAPLLLDVSDVCHCSRAANEQPHEIQQIKQRCNQNIIILRSGTWLQSLGKENGETLD
ncbi:hypothetical protein JHK85_039536 [Glycine max]|nr:hypothetical protein JHK85_039536 [Glycine max]